MDQATELAHCWQAFRELAHAGAPAIDLETAPVRQLAAAGITVDYSRARISEEALAAGADLLAAAAANERLREMLDGADMNFTEGRAAWHSRLRKPDAGDEVSSELKRASAFAEQVRSGSIRGAGGAYRSVVHIGIGGSYLGPQLLTEALGADGPATRFVANIDPAAMAAALAGLDPATTLIVAVSKSGTTAETRANADAAVAWLADALGDEQAKKQLAAVSANPDAASLVGCPPEQAFRIWDWVGGRYSVWSAVSVTVMIACGAAKFAQLLAGAHAMDQHAEEASGLANLPALLALLRCWHGLALDAQTHCVVAYAHRLRTLAGYLQQLAMESNGKSATRTGELPQAATSEIWWGGEGTNDQHSYFQLLLQGMRPAPADFICFLRPDASPDEHARERHSELLAHCFGMSRALATGRDLAESIADLERGGCPRERAIELAPHLVVPGGQPTTLIMADELTPQALGALLALYEHSVAVQGWLHNINSFDQYGVEFGKQNYRTVLEAFGKGEAQALDAATAAVVRQAREAADSG